MKYISFIKYALLIISAILVILFMVGALGEDAAVTAMLDWMYVLLALGVATAIFMPVINIIQDPKKSVRSLMGLAIVAVVLIVAYAFASDAPVVTATKVFDNPIELKFTDTSLYAMYAALAAAVASILVGELTNLFK